MNKIIIVGRVIPDSNKIHQNQTVQDRCIVYNCNYPMACLCATDYKEPKYISEVRDE